MFSVCRRFHGVVPVLSRGLAADCGSVSAPFFSKHSFVGSPSIRSFSSSAPKLSEEEKDKLLNRLPALTREIQKKRSALIIKGTTSGLKEAEAERAEIENKLLACGIQVDEFGKAVRTPFSASSSKGQTEDKGETSSKEDVSTITHQGIAALFVGGLLLSGGLYLEKEKVKEIPLPFSVTTPEEGLAEEDVKPVQDTCQNIIDRVDQFMLTEENLKQAKDACQNAIVRVDQFIRSVIPEKGWVSHCSSKDEQGDRSLAILSKGEEIESMVPIKTSPQEQLKEVNQEISVYKEKKARLRAQVASARQEEEFKRNRREALQELDGLLQDLERMLTKYSKEVRESTSFDSISLAPDPSWSPEKLRQACEHISSKFKEPILRSASEQEAAELLTRTAKFLLLEGDCLEIYGRLGGKATSKYDFTQYKKDLTAFFSTPSGKVFAGVAIGAGLATLGPVAWAGAAAAFAAIQRR